MADVTISSLSPLTPSTGLVLPVSNGTTTGKVTLSQVCGVMTSAQITSALGYTPYNSTNPAGYITASSLPVSQQLAKAWVNFNGINNTIRRAYNISDIVRNNTGRYTITFVPGTMPDGNYSICGSCNYDNVANTTGAVTFYVMNQTSSSCQVGMRGYNGVDYNCHSVSCQFFY